MRLLIVEDDAPLASGLQRVPFGLEDAAGHGAAVAIGDGAGAEEGTKGCRVAITFPHG